MTVDYISVPLGTLGILASICRILSRNMTSTVYPTVLSFSLGGALLLRSPWLGDIILDRWLYFLTDVHNIPDVAAHILVFVAMCAVVGYVAYAVEYPFILWPLHLIFGATSTVCISVFLSTSAVRVETKNIVLLADMFAYNVLFSMAMCITHLAMVSVLVYALRKKVLPWMCALMLAGALSGLFMAVHRLAVAMVPSVRGFAYEPITWTLSLLCIGGYTVAVVGMSWAMRSR